MILNLDFVKFYIKMEEGRIIKRAKNFFNSDIEHTRDYSKWEMTKEI